jgi:P-type Cu2+ transporter
MPTASSVVINVAASHTTEKSHGGDVDSFNTTDSVSGVFHLLDDPLEWSAFSRLDTQRAGCWESNLMIEGMHCAACALTIEEVLLGVPGVVKAEVSAGSHRARVVWSADAVQPSDWMQAIQSAGYHAVPANDAFARERRKSESRKALMPIPHM